eukprot:11251221-Karenia_brevis.AAC.1
MHREGLSPDVISVKAAISARVNNGQWQCVAPLLHKMHREGLSPDVISFKAAISARVSDGQWQCV